MTQTNLIKRSFIKKVFAGAGFVSVAGYFSRLIASRELPTDWVNENSKKEASLQRKAWLKLRFEPMADIEIKQLLDNILDIHSKS